MCLQPLVGKVGAADSDVGVNHKLQLKLQVLHRMNFPINATSKISLSALIM